MGAGLIVLLRGLLSIDGIQKYLTQRDDVYSRGFIQSLAYGSSKFRLL
jgi:hypothetical protein